MKTLPAFISISIGLFIAGFASLPSSTSAQGPNCVPPPSGLIGWWKADGNTLDSVGGNNGVPHNISYTNGVVGQASACDPENYPYGTYVGVDIPDQPAYALTNSLSIEAWVRPRGDGYVIFFRGDNRPGLDPYALSMQANNTLRFAITDQAGNNATVQTALTYNQWWHVAATLDGNSGTMSIYTNGTLAGQTTTTVRPFGDLIPTDSPGIGIGNVNDGFNNFPFTGDIDEIALYNRALSPGEIQAIYNAGSAGKCPASVQPFLLDIDFQAAYGGSETVSAKSGFAAIGQTADDFWNFYSRNDLNAPGGVRSSGAATNLLLADRTATQIGLTVDNSPGAWASDSTDPMYAAYIYPFVGDMTITITNLPDGLYDVVPYSRDGSFEIIVGRFSYGIQQAEDPNAAGAPVWTEGVQYVRFRNVQVTRGQPLVLTVRNGVGGYATISGLQILRVRQTINASPWILSQPQDQTVVTGEAASFTVSAQGTMPLSFQWLFGGNPIDVTNSVLVLSGSQNSSLLLTHVQPHQAGLYSVVVSNAYGTVSSSNAVLTVLTFPPSITSQPQSVAVYPGSNATFSVQATGTAPLRYQWYFNGAPLMANGLAAGFTQTLSLKNVKPIQAGSYSVKVSNDYGATMSSNAVLTVLTPPVCVPPPDGIVAWWRAESNTWDSVGSNDGQYVPSLYSWAFTTGKVGQAFRFTQGTYLQVPASPDLNLGTGEGLTIEGWIRPDRDGINPIAEWNDGVRVIGAGLLVGSSSAPGVLEATLWATNVIPYRQVIFHSPPLTITNSVWQHVALTFNRTSGIASMYRNGIVVAQTNLGSFTPATLANFYLGYRRAGTYAGARFLGAMDEMSLYNRALTPAEIESVYAADYAGKCPPPPPSCLPAPSGIVGWWRGESNAVDSVNGNNGQISNAVVYARGEAGSAFRFINGYIRIPAASNLDVGAGPGLSVELWVNPDLVQPQIVYGPQSFVEWNSGSGTQGVYLGRAFNRPVFEANLIDTQGQLHIVQSPPGLFPTTPAWQHIGVTYDKSSGVASLYVNGLMVTQTNLGTITPRTSTGLYLGYRPPGSYPGPGLFRGLLDEVSIYNRALSAAEMRSIAAARGAGKCAEPPVIITQPQSQSVKLGSTATFSVNADGTPVLHYQWFFNGGPVLGATDAVLTLADVKAGNAGNYSVVVSNMHGVATSSNAVLNLAPVADATATRLLVISCNGSNATVVLDGSRSFDPNGDPLQYSWTENQQGSAFATGVVSVVVLPLGSHSITLTVNDGLASSSQTITLDVVTAAQAVNRLMELVNAGVSKPQPLEATLSAALASIRRGNTTAAFNQLQAFQNKMRSQVGPVDPALAQSLLDSARDIINALECGSQASGHTHEWFSTRIHHGQGRAHMEFPATPGHTYIVEASTDLVHWEKIGVASDRNDGTFEFDDAGSAQSPMRFYRIAAP